MPGIPLKDIKRIASQLRRQEHTPVNQIGRADAPRPTVNLRYAFVTTAITARSGTTLGTGKVQLQKAIDGVLSSLGGDPVTVRNPISGSNGTVAVGKLCTVTIVEGEWSLLVAEC